MGLIALFTRNTKPTATPRWSDIAEERQRTIVTLERQVRALRGEPLLFPVDPMKEANAMRFERDIWRQRAYRLAALLKYAMRPRVKPKGWLPK